MQPFACAAPVLAAICLLVETSAAAAGGRYQAEFDAACRAAIPGRYCDCIRDNYIAMARKIGGEHAASVAEFMFDVSAMPITRPNETREMAMFRHPSIRLLGPLAGYGIIEKAQGVLQQCKSR